MELKKTFLRRLCIPLLLLTTGAAVFFGWKYYSLVNSGDIANVIDKKRCADCMEYNNVKQAATLDVNLIRTMTRTYQLSNSATNPQATRSVWLSLEKLKQFVYEVESNTCKCDTQKLGVRVYFGVYPPDNDWQQSTNPNGFWGDLDNPGNADKNFRGPIVSKYGSNVYANRATIVMVPTMWDSQNNINVDFDPKINYRVANLVMIPHFLKR